MLFAVKLYDAEAATHLLPQLVANGAPDAVAIPLQNGVEGADIVSRAVGPAHTAGGTCYVSAVIAEPGVIKHTAMDHLLFGELDPMRAARPERCRTAVSTRCRPGELPIDAQR